VVGGLLVLLVVGAGGATFDPVPGPSGARSGSAIEIFEIWAGQGWAGLALSSLLCARLSAAQRKCSAARRILFSRKLARTKLNLSHAHSRACSCAARPDEAAWEATPGGSRAIYGAQPAPGLPVAAPGPAPVAGERANFAAILFRFAAMEWLWLAAGGHRRALFTWSGEAEAATWLAP